MTSKDEQTPEGTSGSRWEPTEATAEQPGVPDTEVTEAPGSRWRTTRPSRSVGIAAAAALAGLVIGGLGGWAAGHGDEHRPPPALVGFPHGPGDPHGRFPGGRGGSPFGGPGGPGVVPDQPGVGQGGDSDDSTGDGQTS